MPNQRLKNHERVTRALSSEILKGKYKGDGALPTEKELGERFSVSRITVRRALSDLEHMGLVYRRHGSGTYAYPVQKRTLAPIALILLEPHKLSNPYFADLIRGANTYLMTIGSHISVLHRAPRDWSPTFGRSFAGAIVVPSQVTVDDLESLRKFELPFVVCPNSDIPAPTVGFDVRKAAETLTSGLIALGHRRFALISGHDEGTDMQKKEGIAMALKAAGIEMTSVPDYRTNYDEQVGRDAAYKIMKDHPETTAVVATDDVLGVIMVQTAIQSGRCVPRDLSVVGFNDLSMSALLEPALSTVHFPIAEAGRCAAEMLCLCVLKRTPLSSIDLPYRLVWRQSTAPAT